MSQEEINSLIRKVLSQSATQEEIEKLEAWRSAAKKNEQTFKVMQQVWRERAPDPMLGHLENQRQRIWEKAMMPETVTRSRRLSFVLQAKIAAAIAFLLIFGSVLFWVNRQENVVEIQQTMVQKNNPAGQKSKLFLPDGTIVWLNSESSLTYPATFSDSLRWVRLVGEAYFEVAKDEQKPFTVQSGEVFTTALGTSFNISAYAEDENLTVALITGKVKIEQHPRKEEVLLEAGNGFQLNLQSQQQNIFQVEEEKVLAWKLGILTFEGDDFSQVVKKIQRWYGVDVKIEGTPPSDWRLSGRFENEHLSHVIEIIQFGRKFDYTLDNNTLTFRFH